MLPKDIFPENFMKIDQEMAEKIANQTRIKNNNTVAPCLSFTFLWYGMVFVCYMYGMLFLFYAMRYSKMTWYDMLSYGMVCYAMRFEWTFLLHRRVPFILHF